jgi:hypothetical protein
MTDSKHQPKKKLSALLEELKSDYLKKLPEHLKKLEMFTAQTDWPALEEEYHKLKGTGKTYGFPDISVICEKMEFLAKKPEFQNREIFEKAFLLLKEMNDSYQKNEKLDLKNHPVVVEIMKFQAGFK